MTSMFLLLICSVFIYHNFLKPEFPKTRVPKNMVGHCILFSFKNGCFGSSPGFLGLQYPPQFHIMARSSLQSQRATEESSAVEIKELHKSLEKAKREAWMKFICFFMSVFRDDDGCRNFIYFMNMYRYVDFFRCLTIPIAAIAGVIIFKHFKEESNWTNWNEPTEPHHLCVNVSTKEVSQLKDSVMTAKEECQSLQVQVNAQKAHEVKLEMQLQTLQEDLKVPWCLLKASRSPKWHDSLI